MTKKKKAHANVHVAFLAAQKNLKTLVKERFEGDRETAAFEGISLGGALEVITPILHAEGLYPSQPTRFDKYADRAVSLVDTVIVHAESGTEIRDGGWPVVSGIMPPKEMGSRLSFARKQALLSIMGIAPREAEAHDAAGEQLPPGSPAAPGSHHLLLIDGASLIYRAYHGCPQIARVSDGAPVGAVLGFVGILRRLLDKMRQQYAPTHVCVVFDHGKRTFRNALDPAYKANRPETPAALSQQIPLMREAVAALGCAWTWLPGFEADDVLATYAREAVAEGARVTIVSPDKDLLQLIAPRVRLYDPGSQTELTRQSCLEKFGVPPHQATDAQALIGDSIDNVPGAPGIGPVAAGALLEKFGSLEGMLARLDELEPKHRDAIEPNATRLLLSKQLVTLRADAPVTEKWTSFSIRETEAVLLEDFLSGLGPTEEKPRAPAPEQRAAIGTPFPADEADDPKLCAELLLRMSRVKRPAQLPEFEAELTADRMRKLSQRQRDTITRELAKKREALGVAQSDPTVTASEGEASAPAFGAGAPLAAPVVS